jgi:hypothetical protein
LVEHHLDTVGVSGSNPLEPTKIERPDAARKGGVLRSRSGTLASRRLSVRRRGRAALRRGRAALRRGRAALRRGRAALRRGRAALRRGRAAPAHLKDADGGLRPSPLYHLHGSVDLESESSSADGHDADVGALFGEAAAQEDQAALEVVLDRRQAEGGVEAQLAAERALSTAPRNRVPITR